MPDLVGKGSERLYGEGADSEGCTQQIDIHNRRSLFSASLRETAQLHRQFTSRSIGLVHSLPPLVLLRASPALPTSTHRDETSHKFLRDYQATEERPLLDLEQHR
jgi:hypothetical protein